MNNTTLHAIQTAYDGHLFRSRLEARWAVFFNALGVRWEYEKEGFALPSGYYLPDFWIPSLDSWIEIKGQDATERENNLAGELAETTGKNVYIFAGPILHDYSGSPDGATKWFGDGGWDDCHLWCECPVCHTLGIQYEAASNRNCDCEGSGRHGDAGHDLPGRRDRIMAAERAAQYARFEHGETPESRKGF